MMDPMKCGDCGEEVYPGLRWCPHCARPSLFPNVRFASEALNTQALMQRYNTEVAKIQSCNKVELQKELEDRIKNSSACKAMPRWELDRLISSDTAMAATYYQQIDGRCRIPDNNRWDKLRRIADAAFFQAFGSDIHFAALSTNGRWLSNYGDGVIFFKNSMIAHRATVFETNTARWIEENTGKLNIPQGHTSTWQDKAFLAVAKLGGALCENLSDLDSLILSNGISSANDEFIEVHILGGFTIKSAEGVVVRSGALGKLGMKAAKERSVRSSLSFSVVP